MSENMQEAAETPSKLEGLISHTFTAGNGSEITRLVYPEVEKFHRSIREASVTYQRARVELNRERQRYLWLKEDEFYASPTYDPNRTYDSYADGRQWDREQGRSGAITSRELEHRYYDFVGANSFHASNRYNSDNPNAWAILREEAYASGHEMIVWIVDNCRNESMEAQMILNYLPATPAELWAAAKEDNSMCEVFDRFMEQAERAGLFKADDLPAGMRQMQALRSYIRRTFGSSYIAEFTRSITPIIKANVEYQVKEEREQWERDLLAKFSASKDMDELLRSLAEAHPILQTHVNRSDAAKQAWARRRGETADVNEEITA